MDRLGRGAFRHSFLNDHDPDVVPALFAVLGRLTGSDPYHEPSARDARRRMVSFFDLHLKAPADPERPTPDHPGRPPGVS